MICRVRVFRKDVKPHTLIQTAQGAAELYRDLGRVTLVIS